MTAPQLESAVKWAGGECQFRAVDVTNAKAVEAAAEAIVERWGRIDVLINNAGIVRDAQLVKWNGGSPESIMSEDTWDSVIGVNLKGVFLVTRAIVPHMIKGGGGVILFGSLGCGTSGQLRADQLRGLQGGRHRHDAHLGAGIGQAQDPRQRRSSGIHCDGHGKGHAAEDTGSYGGADPAGTGRDSRRRGQHILLARVGPGKLHPWHCDFGGRRRGDWNLEPKKRQPSLRTHPSIQPKGGFALWRRSRLTDAELVMVFSVPRFSL